MGLSVFSNGGGVQSTACLVLAAEGKIDFPIHLFCNTGEDSENPRTLEYVRSVAMPYAEAHGVEFIILQKQRRGGGADTLLGHLERSKNSIDIPMRMDGGAPGNRKCTGQFKIMVVAKWLREHGATAADPATVGLGISLDEISRARSAHGIPYQVNTHPLIDLRMSRQDCLNVIARAGLPVAPKSSCYFCPFKTLKQWKRLKADEPELFEKAVEIEAMLNARRAALGKDAMWMSGKLKPLDQAVGDAEQDEFDFGLGVCESGYCMT